MNQLNLIGFPSFLEKLHRVLLRQFFPFHRKGALDDVFRSRFNFLEIFRSKWAFKGKIIEDQDLTVDGTYELRAKGELTIHGVSQERIIKSDVTVHNKIITLKSSFSVLLSDHNIPIPKVVYQKLANEIKVDIKATLEPR